jgi:hypothetical protein
MAPYYPEGKHPATIVGQLFDDGKYGLQFILEIEIDDNTGNKRTVYLSLTDEKGQRAQYADITIEVLRHLGFAGSEASLARLDPDAANHFSFIGCRCEGYCKHKTNEEGKTGERWYINTPRAAVERTPPEKNALRKLDSLFGKELKEPPPEGAQPPQQATQQPEQPTDADAQSGDDIPFN